MLDLIYDCLAPEAQLKKLGGLAGLGTLERKVQVLLEDITQPPWEKVDLLIQYARTLYVDTISMLLALYAATSRLRIPINRAMRRRGGISVNDQIDTVHHFFYFALETQRGYPEQILKVVSYFWDDLAARVVRGKPDHEDLLANRLGMEWGNLLRADPAASAGQVLARSRNQRSG